MDNSQLLQLQRKHLKQPPFQIGDIVELYDHSVNTSYSCKLVDKWLGPYYIHKDNGDSTYQIKTPQGKILNKPIHGSQMKIYNVPQILFRPTYTASFQTTKQTKFN